jgi:hypothetical protein
MGSEPMISNALIKRTVALLGRTHKLKRPLVSDLNTAVDPRTGKDIHAISVVSAADGNGPAYRAIVDDDGNPVEAADSLFDRGRDAAEPVTPGHIHAGPGAVKIDPDHNVLTLNQGDTFNESITVTIPKNAAAPRADVYFLADTTASMGGIINAVRTGANTILTALSGLGVDLAFGVGNYKDFPHDPYAFQHQLSPTNVAANVTAAINTWSASGGFDSPEAQLYALDRLAVPPGGAIGWRAGAKRIIVWFGDVPGHDPICAAISGAAAAITEATVTANLTGENITVIAISTANPGLDGDPTAGAVDYTAACGPPAGTPGQGTRLAAATGGTFVTGINPTNIVNTIIGLVSAAVSSINNVRLVPSASIAPFVASITPAGGYGPLQGDREHVLKFEVRFTGTVPCKPDPQVFTGTLDVVADGAVIAAKRVEITVPACAKAFVYSVKFVCGTQAECGCECAPVRPGHYATEINIHNYSGKEVQIRKRVIPVVLAGAAAGREPRAAGVRAEDKITLPPHSATMDDCCRIGELLFGGASASLTIGFLEITASAEVAVTAVYTSTGPQPGAVSIDVEEIRGRQA